MKKMKESVRGGESGEEDDTAERRERGVYVCVTSAVEENCLTAIRRLLNDNLFSCLRWLAYPSVLPFLLWVENTSASYNVLETQ